MNYKDYKMIKRGEYCSVGMFGDAIYAYEYFTGFADVPVYIQITKEEFDHFGVSSDFGERKPLCSGYRNDGEIVPEMILSDEEIEQKKKDKSLWRAGVYSKDYYDGQGVVVFDYTPYQLKKRAYEDTPQDTSLLGGFKSIRQGYLWQLAYEEVCLGKYPIGTYCEVGYCTKCQSIFFINSSLLNGCVFCPECRIK